MNTLFRYSKDYYQNIVLMVLFLFCIFPSKFVLAQDAECAEVKIVIEQKLSFERQAFDARMVISNGLTESMLKNVHIELLFTDKNNQPVSVTEEPNAEGATFFYWVNSLSGINSIEGNGQIPAKSNAEIHWLIIPSYGAAEFEDTLYFIGAKVSYSLNDQVTEVEVTPDYVMVRPQPMLTLDYFLPSDVYGDDPFTPEVEPSIPFTLGVRVKNFGAGSSYKTMIESAQPKIVENNQNLLIDFKILGGYVDNETAGKSLLLDFGDIDPKSSKVGRWNMITTLSGQFVEFDATFTHADTLGGKVTSLLKEVNTHTLVHDVKVDLVGKDNISDFLALDGDVLRVYESQGMDSEVVDQSANATIEKVGRETKIVFPATEGLVYVKLADSNLGTIELTDVKRSDGKHLSKENAWLSKIRNEDLSWSHFINLFDTNSTGNYSLFVEPKPVNNDNCLMYFNSFEDEAGAIWEPYNGAEIVADNMAITGYSLSLDPVKQSYLKTDSNKPFDLGTGEFTIEFWIKPNVFNLYSQPIISGKAVNGGIIRVAFDGNMPVLTHYDKDKYYYASGMNVVGAPISVGVWSHIAVTRDKGGKLQWFLNGKKRPFVNTQWFTNADFKTIEGTYIGTEAGRLDDPLKYFNGYLNQLRIHSKVLYTDEFTPSREPY